MAKNQVKSLKQYVECDSSRDMPMVSSHRNSKNTEFSGFFALASKNTIIVKVRLLEFCKYQLMHRGHNLLLVNIYELRYFANKLENVCIRVTAYATGSSPCVIRCL